LNRTVLDLLDNVLGAHKDAGGAEKLYQCPFCHHYKPKLAVNIESGRWHCWICGAAGRKIVSLFKKLNVSREQIAELRELLKDTSFQSSDFNTNAPVVLQLPPFKPLWIPTKDPQYKIAVSYLIRRGVTPYDVMKYQIGYCGEGKYAGRIIIPSYDKAGKLNYFIARSFYPDVEYSYMNPLVSKDVVIFESQVNWSEDVVLCEGAFDAMAIKRNAIPLLGKYIQPNLKKELMVNQVENIYLALDTDALRATCQISEILMNEGKNVYYVNVQDKDPSNIGFSGMIELKKAAQKLSFSDLIKLKLSIVSPL
jgi:transcription elongation factor Elf1